MARYFGLAVIFVFLLASVAFSATGGDVLRITPEELNARVARGERIFVIDVRSPGSYERSAVKIRGAVRVAPNELFKSATEFPSDSALVLYCT
ncbi:MAG: rhodanese-like domain-containing protein [Deltaproteobacteria bacterium]